MNTQFVVEITRRTLISALGCGGQSGDMPDFGSVEGVLSLEGIPVAGASVPSSGMTDDSGRYSVHYSVQAQVNGGKSW